MPLKDLIDLGQNRWIIALLADLAAHNGARFAELLHRLDLPRDSLARTLMAARNSGWVMPNPGYGHPLRPDYILTEEGKRIAVKAARIAHVQEKLIIPPSALTRWSLPLIAVINHGETRFNGMSRQLPQATPRALSQSLRNLSSVNLVHRGMVEGYPPVTRYILTDAGTEIARAA